MKIPGFGAEFGSESVSQRYGSADPDPYQNVTDPQHWSANVNLEACEIFEFISRDGMAKFAEDPN
jgi:hypothetical protein